jgi:tripartite-type tricarboxylate transporter receptor subunit TctC
VRAKQAWRAAVVAAGVAALHAGPAVAPSFAQSHAQSYPTRVIKVIVPFTPGGADVMARLLADRLTAALGQPVIVENRPGGAGGTVGAKAVAAADPDGYTLLFTSPAPLTTSAAVYRNLDYDPRTSFAPVATSASTPFLVVVPSRPARSTT